MTTFPKLNHITRAPEFAGISQWLNSSPLTVSGLRGRPVLIDFWAFSCVNCLRSLPQIKRWHKAYQKKGLMVIGIHTPEFEFEKLQENLEASIRRLKIEYPVAMDNDFGTWNAFANQYWPARYLIDQEGYIVHQHYGEGEYEQTEKLIRALLRMGKAKEGELFGPGHFGRVGTPEIYWGLQRLQWFGNKENPVMDERDFRLPPYLPPNFFGIEGRWRFAPEYAELVSEKGLVRLNFFAAKVHMVAKSASISPVTLSIRLDGTLTNEVQVEDPRLYTLHDGREYGPHLLEIEAEKGLEAYTFTFG